MPQEEEREYFVLRSDEDETKIDGPFTKTELLNRITPDDEGVTWYGETLKFTARIPESDGGCWIAPEGTAIIIIKGRIVIPRAVKQIVKIDVD